MKAILYRGKEEIQYTELAKPSVGAGEALVKIAFAGICGSDMFIYTGTHPRAKAPLIMGHEFSGEIAALPQGYSESFAVGDKVTINPLISCQHCTPCQTGNTHVCKTLGLTGIDTDGGFTEYAKVPVQQLVKLPDNMNMEHGAIVEPVAVAVHAIRSSALKIGDKVLVIGGGPIGVLVALAARHAGAENIIVIEPNEFRRNIITELGFTALPQPDHELIMNLTNSDGVDIVFEAAGVQASMDAATKYCKIRGQIVIVSSFKKAVYTDLLRVNFAELNLIGIRVYTQKDFAAAVELVEKYPEFAKVITHKFPLAEAQKGLDLMKQGADNLKVLLYPEHN